MTKIKIIDSKSLKELLTSNGSVGEGWILPRKGDIVHVGERAWRSDCDKHKPFTGEVIKITHIFDGNSQWSLEEADEIRIFIKKVNKDDNKTY